MICLVCNKELKIKWTIKHGYGFCIVCGTPYTLYETNTHSKIVKNLKCNLSDKELENAKTIYRLYGTDLEKFSNDEGLRSIGRLVNLEPTVKENLTVQEQEIIDKANGDKALSYQDIYDCIKKAEGRDQLMAGETIKLVAGEEGGVIVSQRDLGHSQPKFYPICELRKIYADLDSHTPSKEKIKKYITCR